MTQRVPVKLAAHITLWTRSSTLGFETPPNVHIYDDLPELVSDSEDSEDDVPCMNRG